MKYILTTKWLFFLLGISINVYSQFTVVDSITKEPLKLSHIVTNSSGLVTNDDGYFELDNDINSFKVVHLGYKDKIVNNIYNIDTIFMTENEILLDDVLINTFSAVDTVSKALFLFKKNYYQDNYNSSGLFRSSTEENNIGVQLGEASFKAYKNRNTNSFYVKLNESIVTNNVAQTNFETITSPDDLLNQGDLVKNGKNFLNPKELNFYDYSYKGKINDGKSFKYIIAFKPKNNSPINRIRHGKLFINSSDLAIIQIEYSFLKENLEKVKQLNLQNLDPNTPNFFLVGLNNIIKYRKQNGYYFLSSIDVSTLKEGLFKKSKNLYNLNSKLYIFNNSYKNISKIKRNNYDGNKDMMLYMKKFSNEKGWIKNKYLSLSNKERKVLKDISSIENKSK